MPASLIFRRLETIRNECFPMPGFPRDLN